MEFTLEWMMWTLPTAGFFITIALALVAMSVWDVISPSVERKGFLPLRTTRGDRFFIGLLSSGYIHLAWLGVTDLHPAWATAGCVLWILALLRWG